MPFRVKYDDGTILRFDDEPSEEDILSAYDEVYSSNKQLSLPSKSKIPSAYPGIDEIADKPQSAFSSLIEKGKSFFKGIGEEWQAVPTSEKKKMLISPLLTDYGREQYKEAGIGLLDSATFGAGKIGAKMLGTELPKPETSSGKFSRGLGEMVGFGVGGPLKAGRAAVAKFVPKAGKFTKGAVEGLASMASLSPSRVLTGETDLKSEAIAVGASGVIGGLANKIFGASGPKLAASDDAAKELLKKQAAKDLQKEFDFEVKTSMNEIKGNTLRLRDQKKVVESAFRSILSNPSVKLDLNSKKAITFQLVDLINDGTILIDDAPKLIKKYGITGDELGTILGDTVTWAGRSLNLMSRLSKAIAKEFPESDVLKGLADQPLDWWSQAMEKYRTMDNFRRAMLISQPSTAMRNIFSQGGRFTIGMFDKAIQGVFRKLTGVNSKHAFTPFVEDFASILRQTTAKGRNRVTDILSQFPLEEAKLFSAPVLDVTRTGKFVKLVTGINAWQENLFRKLAFDSRFTSSLKMRGFNPNNLKGVPDELLGEIIPDAVQHALEMTFAKTPKGGFGGAVMALYKNFPLLTTAQPFPRFLLNATEFLVDHSPGGFIKLFNPKVRQIFNLTNPQSISPKLAEEAIQIVSRATLGTTLMASGVALRYSPLAGDKWYELRGNNGRTYDIRAYFPLSFYCFLGQVLKDHTQLSNNDWKSGFFDIGRVMDNAFPLEDILNSKYPETRIDSLTKFVGNYVGGFSVPLKFWSDVLAQFDSEEAKVRTTQLDRLTGPFVKNIPVVSQTLPESRSVFRAGPIYKKNPLVKQILGITPIEKTQAERDVELGGEETWNLQPKTGEKKLNLMLAGAVGERFENEFGDYLTSSPKYKALDAKSRLEVLKIVLSALKKEEKPTQAIAFIVSELQNAPDELTRQATLERLRRKRNISQKLVEELAPYF